MSPFMTTRAAEIIAALADLNSSQLDQISGFDLVNRGSSLSLPVPGGKSDKNFSACSTSDLAFSIAALMSPRFAASLIFLFADATAFIIALRSLIGSAFALDETLTIIIMAQKGAKNFTTCIPKFRMANPFYSAASVAPKTPTGK